jgi:hypothetical protein
VGGFGGGGGGGYGCGGGSGGYSGGSFVDCFTSEGGGSFISSNALNINAIAGGNKGALYYGGLWPYTGVAADGFVYLAIGGVPEPATWISMILGFAAIGFVLRRARLTLCDTNNLIRKAADLPTCSPLDKTQRSCCLSDEREISRGFGWFSSPDYPWMVIFRRMARPGILGG